MPPSRPYPSVSAVSVGFVALFAIAGCVPNAPAEGEAIDVTATDTACEVAADSAPSGPITFEVQNDGTEVTEFYLLAEDGLQVIGEVEDIAPDASRSMTVDAEPGEYLTLCKPGMTGEGVGRAPFTVTAEQ